MGCGRYIAFALSSLPRRAPLSSLLVYSRLGLGVGGVIIVAASVIAALGVQPPERINMRYRLLLLLDMGVVDNTAPLLMQKNIS